ncbi:DUF4326 domain-containing protein [Pseudarthrobacter sp. PS3-L1]|uniref:DUF4326 domain-containing protein n=1 Tax=Pseudarthrobacter sp. PS3-L1 TaxID=3046207 RepID=UPI0024B88299|nr:DUF4326 domain-containing protein [Pseudarthrobacter sp. PS3-L1]MDJ0321675.1 DUF4326 domain-containing protein [Pseudarthrobacter sp. PS3-L1]
MSETPVRVQRKRTKGWRMPENTVYVGRGSKWGNPYKVGAWSAYWSGPGFRSPSRPTPIPRMDAEEVTGIYRNMVRANCAAFNRDEVPTELAGKNLACWCPLDQPCHADVLLEIANTK